MEINPAAEKKVKYKDLHTVYKHSKQSGTAASKQNNSESTPKVTNVENNQAQEEGSSNSQGKDLAILTLLTLPNKLYDQLRPPKNHIQGLI